MQKIYKKTIRGFFVILIFTMSFFPMNFSQNKQENYVSISTKKNMDNVSLKKANWQSKGAPVCLAVEDQEYPKIIADGEGGSIIVWRDERESGGGSPVYDLYAQKINKTGSVQWTKNGVAVCNETGNQYSPDLCTDGNGGVIIGWRDWRDLDFCRIYIQKINKSGFSQWEDNGTLIYEANSNSIYDLSVLSDNNGGAFITWTDLTSSYRDVYIMRINPDATMAWKRTICNVSGDKNDIVIDKDGNNGVVLAWVDPRGSDNSIYAQRISFDGNLLWADNGTFVCNTVGTGAEPVIRTNSSSYSIIAWLDIREGEVYDHVYAQHIDSSGTTLWQENGILISNASSNHYKVTITGSDLGGAIIAWDDGRNYMSKGRDIYAQKVDYAGNTLWDDNGTVICNEIEDQTWPHICSDGEGGAFIAWSDERFLYANDDIFGQHINSTGYGLWGANGTAICIANLIQEQVDLISDGKGGAFITWQDQRKGTFRKDIYCEYLRDVENTTVNPINPSNDDDGIIEINWSRIDNAWEYHLYRDTAPIEDVENLEAIITTSKTNYIDSLSTNGTYYYAVTVSSFLGNSSISNYVAVEVKIPPPDAPNLYEIEPNIDSDGFIELNWSEQSDAHLYHVFRNASPIYSITDLNPIATVINSNYIDEISINGEYYYVVIAEGLSGNSSISNCQKVNVSIPVQIPFSPILLPIEPNPSENGSISLSWGPCTGATIYYIYRDTNNIESLLGLEPIGDTDKTYYIDNITVNGIYYYALVASNSSGNSTISNCESVSVEIPSEDDPTDENPPDDDDNNEGPTSILGYNVIFLIFIISLASSLWAKKTYRIRKDRHRRQSK